MRLSAALAIAAVALTLAGAYVFTRGAREASVQPLDTMNPNPGPPIYSAAYAISVARTTAGSFAGEPTAELGTWPGQEGSETKVWRVRTDNRADASYVIDARSGKVLATYPPEAIN